MKKYFFWSILVFLFFALPPAASAHFPKVVGDTTITLHIEPNDDPIPGEQAILYFLFSDNFKLETCSCTISITEQNKQIFQKQLDETRTSKPSIWGTSLPYIFPQNDVYQISLNAKPKIGQAFKPFTVSWYFRVYSDTPTQTTTTGSDFPIMYVVIIGITIFVLLGVFIKKQIIDADEDIDKTKINHYAKKTDHDKK